MAFAEPRLLYLNRGTGATITSSAEDTAGPDDNAADWRNWLRWTASGANSYWIKYNAGSGVTASALALSGHNINTNGARYKLEGSNNDADWTSIVAYQTPSDDLTRADFFTEVTYQYYRLTIDNNGGANFSLSLGLFFVGGYIEFPVPPEMPADPDRQTDHTSKKHGESGNLLGIAQDWTERKMSWTFLYLSQTWATNTWIAYWDDYRFKPFIWVWDYLSHSTEVYLMEWDMNEMTVPYDSVFRSLQLEMHGVKEE